MEHPDLVIDPFNKSETDFVFGMTIGGDPIPVGFNHCSELPVRLQSLPLQAVLPALEEGAGTPFGPVVPQLAESFLEQIGRVQTPVGLEQLFQGPSAVQTQVLAPRQQRITLALDVAAVLAAEPLVFPAPDLVQSLG